MIYPIKVKLCYYKGSVNQGFSCMYDLKKLKLDAKGFSILYVEDNDLLRRDASNLLNKFFDTVYIAVDGQDGLNTFKEYLPQIVITDIKMPNMDGIELARHIKDINHETKIIVMSAYDDTDKLLSFIELGIFRFLKKPVNINDFSDVVHLCIKEIKKEQNTQLFNNQLSSIFNYQTSMVVMMEDGEVSFANKMFLDYFEVKNIEEFTEEYDDIGELFLQHDGFLYNTEEKYWFDDISINPQKLYNVKMEDKDGNLKHFILKYQEIPDKESYGILSFDDVTELNLLQLYDASQAQNDENTKDSKSLYKLLEVIWRNSAKIELHNYYKGLSITNDAVIMDIKEDSIVLKTDYMQEKAIQYDKRSFITSDALPNVIACDNVKTISFKHNSVELTNIHFAQRSPVARKALRVVPEEKHTASLFLNEHKFYGYTFVEDISLEAVKLNLEALPAALKMGDEVFINLVLSINQKPIIIHLKAVMFRVTENKRSFSVVF